jgi:tetratricopeptide (TPR) repeat protein
MTASKFAIALVFLLVLGTTSSCSSGSSSEADWQKATDLMREKKYEEALPFLDKYIAAEPTSGAGYSLRSVSYEFKGEHEKALQDSESAIRLAPKGTDLTQEYRLRGNAFYELRRYKEAIGEFSKVLAAEPDNARVYEQRAVSYFHVKDIDKALADSTRLLQLEPKNSVAYWAHGQALASMNKQSEAIKDLTEAIRLDPQNPEFYSTRGEIYIELKQFPKALSDFDKSIGIKPSATDYTYRGALHALEHQPAKALQDYTQAIALDPKHLPAYVERALTYKKLGKHELAKQDEQTATSLGYEPD